MHRLLSQLVAGLTCVTSIFGIGFWYLLAPTTLWLYRPTRQTTLLGRSQLQAALHYAAATLSRAEDIAPPPLIFFPIDSDSSGAVT